MTFLKGNSMRLVHGANRNGKRTKAYRAWAHIRGRCNNPSDAAYYLYGARGIKVCARWDKFDHFLSDMGEPAPHLTIERLDSNGDYCPENCKWATRAEQSRNTARTIKINGKCLKDVCADLGLAYGAVQARIRRGMPITQALGA